MIKNLDSRLSKLQAQRDYLCHKLSTFPEGELSIQKNGSYHRWIIKTEEQKTYCPKSNRSLAEIMALKKYYSLLLLEVEEELSLLTSYKNKLSYASHSKELSASDLLSETSPYYELLQTHFAKNKLPTSVQKWHAEAYETNGSHPEHLIHTTLAGHKVRSKSEVIIANLLYTNGIPYRYEAALILNEMTIYPDFTILHPTSQQIFYWEHFGMMDKNNYCDAACNKLKSYCYNGIYPSMQLITTYETGKVPIRSEQVQQIISQYFL